MKIYTRRGDAGKTDLFGGTRVDKDALRVEAYGAVDELNASLGVAAAASSQTDLRDFVRHLQESLFALGGYLASPSDRDEKKSGVDDPSNSEILRLEAEIDRLEAELEPLKRFVLPGGSPAAAAFHTARTICRRAERRVVSLGHEEAVAPAALGILNRLSDLLFVMARVENRRAGVADVEWQGRDG